MHATIAHVATRPDPIEAAIARHRAAYDAFQVAPEGEPSENAQIAYCEESEALMASFSATRFGALTLFEHLRWWLAAEVESAHAYQPAYSIAQARVAELSLFLGDGLSIPKRPTVERITVEPRRHRVAPVLPRDEDVPGSIEPWQAVTPVRPDTAHSRALRIMNAGAELLACFVIIGGGAALVGLASHF